MGVETTDVVLRILGDSKGIKEASAEANSALAEVGKAAAGAAIVVAGVGAAYAALVSVIDRGQGVSELTAAFSNLGGSSAKLDTLRTSVQGLVSDTDLMRASNQAMLSGLKPDQFLAVAAAADTLGDAVGVNTKDALDQLTTALSTGNERLLKQYGIVVDNAKAEADFAKSIGKTAGELNEAGKKEAARVAILTQIEQKTTALNGANETAGDLLQRLGVTAANSADGFAKMLNEAPLVLDFLRGLNTLASDASQKLDYLFSASTRAAAARKVSELQDAQRDLAVGEKFYPFNTKALDERRAAVARLQAEYDALIGQLKKEEVQVKVNNSAYVDSGKAALNAANAKNKAAEDALAAFKKEGEGLVDIFDSMPIFGEKGQQLDYTYGENALKESFKNSVDFFGDLLTPMFEGQAANFEDIFLDAAKRVAIGFGSQMLASLAQVAGFSGLGEIGDAGGLGKAIAATLGFGGGGQKGLADFVGPLPQGAAGIAGGAGVGAASSLASLGTTFGSLAGGGVVIVATGAGAALMAQGVKDGNILKGGGGGAIAGGALLGGIGASILGPLGAGLSFFGGDSEKSQEREQREALLDSLFEGAAQFGGTRGSITLDPGKFNPSGKFGGQGTGLVNPLAQIFSGGDDKLGSDLAGIFENGVTDGENFNEVIVNTLSLMDQLNITAEDAKPQLAELFLDGKVSLDEFATGIANLNILATENLVGEGSVADAIGIMSSELATPREQLKGLELAFKEMSEIGVDTTGEIHAYLTEHFSPDVVAVFDKLAASGIDTFEEIANAGPDSLVAIFGPLSELKKEFEDTARVAAEFGNTDSSAVIDDLRTARKEARELTEEYHRLNKAKREFESSSGSYNPNQGNNLRPEG